MISWNFSFEHSRSQSIQGFILKKTRLSSTGIAKSFFTKPEIKAGKFILHLQPGKQGSTTICQEL